MVVVPGTEGQMGFLYDHVPLVSALADGVVRYFYFNRSGGSFSGYTPDSKKQTPGCVYVVDVAFDMRRHGFCSLAHERKALAKAQFTFYGANIYARSDDGGSSFGGNRFHSFFQK